MVSTKYLGITFHAVKRDKNGNPRAVVHFMDFLNPIEQSLGNYNLAAKRAKAIGFSVYRGKDFGGSFVNQSWYFDKLAQRIISERGDEVSDKFIDTLTLVKSRHPGAIILVADDTTYSAYEEDAIAVSQITGLEWFPRYKFNEDHAVNEYRCICFVKSKLDEILPMLMRSGRRVVIAG